MDAIVARILQECEVSAKKGKTLDLRPGAKKTVKKSNKKPSFHKIAKCWTAIRFIAEEPFFSSDMVPVIEESVKPLLVILTESKSSETEFDDDIMFFVSSLIKKSKVCSQFVQ